MEQPIRVLVSGAAGKMGREVCRAVMAEDGMVLVAAVDTHPVAHGKAVRELLAVDTDGAEAAVAVDNDLASAIESAGPDVLVDFTHPTSVLPNVETALSMGVDCVVGTTGIDDRLGDIEEWARRHRRRAFVAPNFTIGAVLMMHMAKIAAKHMPSAEVIELHHDQKADAPSGTAVATAVQIARVGASSVEVGNEKFAGARGAKVDDVRVHSVRLPGYVAHQEVIFGSPGQTLSIRHDSIDRAAYMPGVILAIRTIGSLGPFTVGLEHLMGLGELS